MHVGRKSGLNEDAFAGGDVLGYGNTHAQRYDAYVCNDCHGAISALSTVPLLHQGFMRRTIQTHTVKSPNTTASTMSGSQSVSTIGGIVAPEGRAFCCGLAGSGPILVANCSHRSSTRPQFASVVFDLQEEDLP